MNSTLFQNKSVLLTGGTGSFGYQFANLVLKKYKPKRLVIFSRDELKQFEMSQYISHPNVRFFIGDVRDEGRLQRAMNVGIDIVMHAAALKQVATAEYNPIECIKTNVLGAENIINVSINSNVKKVIAISTDKAVNPINLYGASKLCSDKLFIAANNLSGKSGTKFSVVRYGNVVASRGSVIPFFKEQRASGTIPITDKRITRFWITVNQGAQFAANCSELMQGGEIFIKKSPSMKIIDLAKAIAPECKQKEIGIRQGEKLHETMLSKSDAINTREFKQFYITKINSSLWNKGNFVNYNREKPKKLLDEFEYSSNTNKEWVNANQIKEFIN